MKRGQKQTLIETTDVKNEKVRRKAALTLLKTPFVIKTRHENANVADEKKDFTRVLNCLTLFNVQLLRRLQLLDEKVMRRTAIIFDLSLVIRDFKKFCTSSAH